jgi:hypothetical protein
MDLDPTIAKLCHVFAAFALFVCAYLYLTQ